MSESKEQTNVEDDITEFITNLSYEDVPEDSAWLAERAFVDTVGVMLAGRVEKGAGSTVLSAINTTDEASAGKARVVGTDSYADLPEAALANGTAGHSLDFDDSTPPVPGHLSVTLVTPILGFAETRDVSGEDAITAYVAGFETAYTLSQAIRDGHYFGGWHSTATYGTFCSVAASASLLGLGPEETRHALNITASLPAGLRANFGSMTKPLHAGHAARSGLTAARLAENGFTAADNAISGEQGFFEVYRGDGPVELDDLPEIGEEWGSIGAGADIKKYPACHAAHSAISITESFVEEHELRPEDIERIHVSGTPQTTTILTYDNPTDGNQAKFSMQHSVACAVAHDRVGLHSYRDVAVNDETIKSLIDRIEFDGALDGYDHPRAARVTIETVDGQEFSRERALPPGHHEEDPLSEEDLKAKFMMCATEVYDEHDADTLYRGLRDLREVDDVASVFP